MKKANFTKKQKEEIIAIMRSFGATVGYLFGSYARGAENSRSDIDVAVAFPYEMMIELQENYIEGIRNNLEKRFLLF